MKNKIWMILDTIHWFFDCSRKLLNALLPAMLFSFLLNYYEALTTFWLWATLILMLAGYEYQFRLYREIKRIYKPGEYEDET